jgi:membrane-associated protease RseP (regulator of RpoE activity)
MKKNALLNVLNTCAKYLAAASVVVLAGCASEKEKPLHERGWIGGEYALARREAFRTHLWQPPGTAGILPKSLAEKCSAAVWLTKLDTNSPAAIAGLKPGDFVLEINNRPVKSLEGFRRMIDRTKPGTSLAVKALRDDKEVDCTVPAGREKYKSGGWFSIVFPTVVHRWDLWPDPGFSLIMIGYEPNPGTRKELGGSKEAYDEEWSAYLVCFEMNWGKRIHSQELVAAAQ